MLGLGVLYAAYLKLFIVVTVIHWLTLGIYTAPRELLFTKLLTCTFWALLISAVSLNT